MTIRKPVGFYSKKRVICSHSWEALKKNPVNDNDDDDDDDSCKQTAAARDTPLCNVMSADAA